MNPISNREIWSAKSARYDLIASKVTALAIAIALTCCFTCWFPGTTPLRHNATVVTASKWTVGLIGAGAFILSTVSSYYKAKSESEEGKIGWKWVLPLGLEHAPPFRWL